MSVIGNAEPVDIEDTQSYPAECLTGKVWVSFTCSGTTQPLVLSRDRDNTTVLHVTVTMVW